MYFKTPLLLALALSASSAMAADVPYQGTFEQTTQLKALSVQHWTVIADDLVKATLASLDERVGVGAAVYIAPADGASAFDQSLHTFVVNSFYKAGVKVYSVPTKDALTVEINSAVTRHMSKADPLPPLMGTALAAGVLVVRDIALDNWKAGLLALNLGRDLLRPYDKELSRTELTVTVSVENADKLYAARQSSVYYIDNADINLFRHSGKTLRIVGGK